ncbi:hypothetical protein [Caballeronia ptereochthonis]|uniref:hypothetical protein n=1 Tax=Caballeronia ptereochthonis TaxID=1777144 RepID=UPI001180ABF3|nr:hypothetical protein [Caballeronia ptereochthonis]
MKSEAKFVVVENFEEESRLHDDRTMVRVLLRRHLNYQPSRFTSGPYWLDLHVAGRHYPYYGLSEQKAQELVCRFLLEHVTGVAPTRH